MKKINVVAQSGSAWEEEVVNINVAIDRILDEHDDIERIEDITSGEPVNVYVME